MMFAIETPCREFQGTINKDGYGERRYERPRMLHRWVIFAAGVDQYGTEWDNDLIVMHECDNRQCFRYDHLRLATRLENNRDMFDKRRDGRVGNFKKLCPRGHEYDASSIHPADGHKYQRCRTCERERSRAWNAANPEKRRAAVRRYNERKKAKRAAGN